MGYDSAGRITKLGSSPSVWVYEYDADGRMTQACKTSSSCAASGIDKVEFTYDGDGHRTEIQEYTAGTLTTTRDFLYQGDAIVQESTNGTISREYIDDDTGKIIKFCDPNCTSPTATYLVTWNGHGDALGAWRINGDGTLTLVNSYTYSSWGAPTTTVGGGLQRPWPAFRLPGTAGCLAGQLVGPRPLPAHALERRIGFRHLPSRPA